MNHEELYKHARIYDVAFGYREFDKELTFLVACLARFGALAPTSFLEVAAGPGVHALVAAARGMKATAMDLSASMMELCAEKARARGLSVRTLVADMRQFDVDEPVALAFNPLTSISYLRTRDALVDHMRAMARAVAPGGVYVVENNHPKDFLLGEHFVPSVWTMSEPDLTVETTWIAEAPPKISAYDQCYEAVGRYVVTSPSPSPSSPSSSPSPSSPSPSPSSPSLPSSPALVIEDRAWLRMTLPAEVALAGALAGFDLVAELGDLDVDAPLDDKGWRAVSVLRRR